MIRLLARWWRAAFHLSGAVYVRLTPSGVLIVPAEMVLRLEGSRRAEADGWVYARNADELDRLVRRAVAKLQERPDSEGGPQ